MSRNVFISVMLLFLVATATALHGQSYPDLSQKQDIPKYALRTKWFERHRVMPDAQQSKARFAAIRDEHILKRAFHKRSAISSHLTWQELGPHGVQALPGHWGTTSGRVRAIGVDPQNSSRLFIGAAAGGIWRSNNGGGSWADVGDDLDALTFGAIAVDPVDTDVVYAGSGEARFNFLTQIFQGRGLYKSTDGGNTWFNPTTDITGNTHFSAIAIDPFDNNTVYAALGSGNSFVGNLLNEGIWVSTDAGVNWQQTLPLTDAFDVLPHPTTSGLVFAAIGGGIANQSGLWSSVDNGQNWNRITSGLPADTTILRPHVALSTGSPATMYMTIFESDQLSRVYKSTDTGANWTLLQQVPGGQYPGSNPVDQGDYDLAIAVNPSDPNDVWFGNVEVSRSTDGQTFDFVRNFGFAGAWDSPMHLDYHIFRHAPSNPIMMYAGNDGGLYRSVDGGQSWESRNTGLNTLQFYRIATSPHDANLMIGGAQDNGIIGTDVLTPGTNLAWRNLSTGDGYDCFFHPTDPNIVYASTQRVSLYKSTSGIDGFNFIGIPTGKKITNGIDSTEAANIFFAPFLMHPTDPEILYTATTRPYESTDGGENWTALSGPLQTPARNVVEMAISNNDPDNMIISTGFRIHISTDGGNNWTDRTDSLPNSFMPRVKVSPHSNNMYVVVSSFNAGNKLFKTTDFGATWQNISGNLPDVPQSDIFIDPAFPGETNLYIANDLGVFHSNDGGLFWEDAGIGMPVVPAMDFDYVFAERKLRVATHGRSVYEAALAFSTVALTTPNGGESLAVGAEYPVRWTSHGISSLDNVRLEFSLDNGSSWQTLIAATPNDGEYDWRVPNSLTDSARVRVVNIDNNAIFDQSNFVFSIFQDQLFEVNAGPPIVNDRGTFTSVSWADFNNDNLMDIAVTSEHPTERQLRLYRNRGNGDFQNVLTAPVGDFNLQSSATTWGDFDGDGDLDLFIATIQPPGTLFLNNGSGGFEDATDAVFNNPPLVEMTGAAWVDFDRNNVLDLFVTTRAGASNILFRQTTPGQLVATNVGNAGFSNGLAVADYNNDGYPDYASAQVSGDDFLITRAVRNGANVDLEPLATPQRFPGSNIMSISWADYNNDGRLDLFATRDAGAPSLLYRQNGAGLFVNTSTDMPINSEKDSRTAAWGDFDNDGFVDVFVGTTTHNDLFRNRGDGTFESVTLTSVTTTDDYTNGAAWADLDNDGDLDLFITNGEVGTSNTDQNVLYLNKGNGNSWLNVKLRGVVSNRSGIGARVRVVASFGGALRQQIREITGQNGHGQPSTRAHFGLGNATSIDSLIVSWPSRSVRVLTDLDVNQHITVYERSDQFVQTAGGGLANLAGRYKGTSWGDYNGDDLADLFLINESGRNALYKNLGDGNFEKVTEQHDLGDGGVFSSATWGDFDNDGFKDLYVARIDGPNLLYRNTGFPDFNLKRVDGGEATKLEKESTSCSWGDFNRDGLLDLLVSNRGKEPADDIFQNDGKGGFVRIPKGDFVDAKDASTSAMWVDIDVDGNLDIVVTIKDGNPKIYRNLGVSGKFEFSAIKDAQMDKAANAFGSTWGDYDNDGDPDGFFITSTKNVLFRNNGGFEFRALSENLIPFESNASRTATWTDFTNDGLLDVYVTNSGVNVMWGNNGDGSFSKQDQSPLIFEPDNHAAGAWADMDLDGDQDVFVPRPGAAGLLFNNGLRENNLWLQVICIGSESNRCAIGTRVRAKTQPNSKLDPFWQTRVINGQDGLSSQHGSIVQFGLNPDGAQIDSLVIEWPSGNVNVLTDLQPQQRIVVHEQAEKSLIKADRRNALSSIKTNALGGSWADIDGDEDIDLFVPGGSDKSLLFINDGKGNFSSDTKSEAVQDDLVSVASMLGDVNNDGNVDLFVLNKGAVASLFINRGRGDFSRAKTEIGDSRADMTNCSFADINGDGLLDIYITVFGNNLVYLNQGKGTFKRTDYGLLTAEKDRSTSASWADFDRDGDIDVIMTNDNAPNALYRNNSGEYERVNESPFDKTVGRSTAASWADINNDGALDLLIANDGAPVSVYLNERGLRFRKAVAGDLTRQGLSVLGIMLADYDNDADLDVYLPLRNGTNILYENLGTGSFLKTATIDGDNVITSRAATWGDVDADGSMDLFVANDKGLSLLHRNNGNNNRWLAVLLQGTNSNFSAIGATVRVLAVINGRPVWQTRIVSAHEGGAQNSLIAEFGLGSAQRVDSLVVTWPSGKTDIVTRLSTNRKLLLRETRTTTDIADNIAIPEDFQLRQNYPNPFNPETHISFVLPEAADIELIIYDISGRQITQLAHGRWQAGEHVTRWLSRNQPSGLYFYRLRATTATGRQFEQVRKMTLLR